MGCLLEILAMFSPRLFIALIGGAAMWMGGHFFNDIRREDAPVRRALGPAGIPVEATVYSRRRSMDTNANGELSFSTMTRLRYAYDGQNRSAETYLKEDAERNLPEGSRIACRLDPENPDFILSAKASMPWTKTKLAWCVALIAFGALIALASLAAGAK